MSNKLLWKESTVQNLKTHKNVTHFIPQSLILNVSKAGK